VKKTNKKHSSITHSSTFVLLQYVQSTLRKKEKNLSNGTDPLVHGDGKV